MQSYADIMLEAVSRELLAFLDEVRSDGAQLLDDEGRNYESSTKDALYAEVHPPQGNVIVGVVGSASAHAYWVHEGRGPGKAPPYQEIRRWVERKKGLTGEDADRMTRGIQRRQAKKGSATGSRRGPKGGYGTPFLTQPFEAKRPDLNPRLRAAAVEAMNARV